MLINFLYMLIILCIAPLPSWGADYSYRDSSKFSSDDYFLKENSELRDRAFRDYQILDLGVDLGISTGGCGQINIHKTLRTSLKNLLSEKYFQQLGSNLASSSFLLLTCYWSPQICSILKSSRINASLLSKLRFDECSAVSKYTDSRVQDWEMQRQKCYDRALADTGGDADAAMDRCRKNSFSYDLSDWSGGKSGNPVRVNKLIESSAKWMGFKGPESDRIVNLTKSFVGDSVFAKGKLSVDFGPRSRGISPRMYFQEKREVIEKRLKQIFSRIDAAGGSHMIGRIVVDADLEALSGSSEKTLVNRDIIRALYNMPRIKREAAFQKLSSAVSLHALATDANKSLDLLLVASQNPNLPPHRKKELDEKRRALRESVETTVLLEKQKNEPINQILSRISAEGRRYQGELIEHKMKSRANQKNQKELKRAFFDCSDAFMCKDLR